MIILQHLLTSRTRRIFTSDQHQDKCALFMTRDRTAYRTVQPLEPPERNKSYVVWHLLYFHDIIDASTHKLPRLQEIVVEQYTNIVEETFPTFIRATKQEDGALLVERDDIVARFHTTLAHFDRYRC